MEGVEGGEGREVEGEREGEDDDNLRTPRRDPSPSPEDWTKYYSSNALEMVLGGWMVPSSKCQGPCCSDSGKKSKIAVSAVYSSHESSQTL